MHAAANILPHFGRAEILHATQSAPQIIAAIMDKHNAHAGEYDLLYAKYFSKYTAAQLPEVLYNFIKYNSTYKVESEFRQTLRSPASILKAPFIDCKNYSLFIAGVIDAARRAGIDINWTYRFVSYSNSNIPHHVFIVVDPGVKNIYVDPVLPTFNNRKKYTYKIDRKPMALISMSGIGRKSARKEKRQAKKAVNKQKKAAVKQKIKNRIKKTGKVVLKFAPVTVAGRNAFLLLLKINGLNLATRLAAAIRKDEAKVKKLWAGFGGNFETLKKVAFASANKRAAKIANNKIGEVATAATVATATPIIVKLVQLFKELGIDAAAAKQFTAAIVNKVVENKVDEQANIESSGDGDWSDAEISEGDSFESSGDGDWSDAETSEGDNFESSGDGDDIGRFYPTERRRSKNSRFGNFI